MNKKPKVVAIGEILWDIFPDRKCLGGAPFNFIYHCRNFGLDAKVISAVGSDDLGIEIFEEIEWMCIDSSYIQKTDLPTGTVQISLDDAGQPSYEITKDVAWDNIVFNSQLEKLAKETDVFYFGSLACRSSVTKKTIFQFADKLPKNALRICDINIRQDYYSKELTKELLGLANILKINSEGVETMQEFFAAKSEESEEAFLKGLLKQFDLKLIILTRGEKGSLLFREDEKNEFSAAPITVKDAVGAGDSFTAVICYGLLNDWSLERMNMAANNLARFVCTQSGATPKVKNIWDIVE